MSDGSINERILLVLDLDETLVHASEFPLDREPDFVLAQYSVYLRPHLGEFLKSVAEWYALGIWSTAGDEYVEAVVSRIFPERSELQFVWGRSRCTERRLIRTESDERMYMLGEANFRKPLKKLTRLGWSLERILIVDDTPAKAALNYGNAIYPKPYLGEAQDDELPALASYLKSLRDAPNVRMIEKRRWRERQA